MINGLLCIILGGAMMIWPHMGQTAADYLRSTIIVSQPALALGVFGAAFLEAIFPITFAFPGSFFLIVAVVISGPIENATLIIFVSGTVAIMAGNLVSFALAKLDVIPNGTGRDWPASRVTPVIAAFSNVIPSIGATFAFGIGRSGTARWKTLLLIQAAATPVIVILAITLFSTVGEAALRASNEQPYVAGAALIALGGALILLHRRAKRRADRVISLPDNGEA